MQGFQLSFPAVSRAVVLLAAVAAAAPARAQSEPLPRNVVALSASATVEVTRDWLTVVFSTTREGPDAASVQSQLRQAVDLALAEARKVARTGQLEVQTGTFSLYPRHAVPDPRSPAAQPAIVGWLGSAELVVQGRDMAAISQLTGRVTSLSIARVGQTLSREAREKVEGEVAAQAIARFRARADAVARQFGFTGYSLREVAVASDDGGPRPQPMMAMKASRAAGDESLPVEVGKAEVTATVSGSVQLER